MFAAVASCPFITYLTVIINKFMHLVRLPSVPWIGRLIAVPPLWIGCDFKPVNMGFALDKEAVGRISPRKLDFSPVVIFPPTLCYHIWFVYDRRYIILATDSVGNKILLRL